MALVSNIKWYINWNEWGVYEPAPSLLTYEEIVAMAEDEWWQFTNTLEELNSHYDDYYNMLNDWWYLVEVQDLPMSTNTFIRWICRNTWSERASIIVSWGEFVFYWTMSTCDQLA